MERGVMLDQVPAAEGDHLPIMPILFLALGQITILLDGTLITVVVETFHACFLQAVSEGCIVISGDGQVFVVYQSLIAL